MICGVRSPFSAKDTNAWNYTSVRIGEKNVLLVPEFRRYGVIPHLEQKTTMWHVGLHLQYLPSSRTCHYTLI
jgi:hypothetical protein